MKNILVTGSEGFIGRNLVAHLSSREGIRTFCFDKQNSHDELREWTSQVECIFHLAGVNRPDDVSEFQSGNVGFTETLVREITASGNCPHLIMTSSIQAELANPYGTSKRQAEEVVTALARETDCRVSIFRLKNVFGKWCRPRYNSVVATFCHNIARDMPIEVSDDSRVIELVYVDDVISAMFAECDARPFRDSLRVDDSAVPWTSISLGELADRIRQFRAMQSSLEIPDFSTPFNRQLYATYLSHVPAEQWGYCPEIRSDARGDLAELIKSHFFGQVFVSRTKPGVTRGNHYHHTKTEKFIVVFGQGLVRLRSVLGTEVIEIPVRGEDYRIVEIPPGFTHSITNIGDAEMVTLFWASEVFDPARTDTYFMPVDG